MCNGVRQHAAPQMTTSDVTPVDISGTMPYNAAWSTRAITEPATCQQLQTK